MGRRGEAALGWATKSEGKIRILPFRTRGRKRNTLSQSRALAFSLRARHGFHRPCVVRESASGPSHASSSMRVAQHRRTTARYVLPAAYHSSSLQVRELGERRCAHQKGGPKDHASCCRGDRTSFSSSLSQPSTGTFFVVVVGLSPSPSAMCLHCRFRKALPYCSRQGVA